MSRRLTPEELERQLHATLKSLPAHHAPASLETRVLAAIAAREARPWWRQSYPQWPATVRLAFLVTSAALAGLLIAAGAGLLGNVEPSAAQPITDTIDWFARLRSLGATLTDLVSQLWPRAFTAWLYAGLTVLALVYGTLLGLGTTAYRLLWQAR